MGLKLTRRRQDAARISFPASTFRGSGDGDLAFVRLGRMLADLAEERCGRRNLLTLNRTCLGATQKGQEIHLYLRYDS